MAFYHFKEKNYAAARALLESQLSRLQFARGSFDLAQFEESGNNAPLYVPSTEQRPAHIDLAALEVLALLAHVYALDGDQDRAEKFARSVVAARRYAFGQSNPETLNGVRVLGEVYAAGGKFGRAADALVESELTKRTLVFLPNIAFIDVRTCGFSDTPFNDELRPWRAEKLIAASQFAAQQSRLEHYVPSPMSDCPGLPGIPRNVLEAGVFPLKLVNDQTMGLLPQISRAHQTQTE